MTSTIGDVGNRVIRTLIQLIAAGGATALFEAVTDLAPAQYQALILAIFMMIITFCQNVAEDLGLIPKVLKPEPLTVLVEREPPDDGPRVI